MIDGYLYRKSNWFWPLNQTETWSYFTKERGDKVNVKRASMISNLFSDKMLKVTSVLS